MSLEKRIFVGTFHKTGTILLTDIFTRIAKRLGLVFWQPERDFWRARNPAARDFDIFFDGASRFLWHSKIFNGDARGVISIRDPRDVVVSSALYHVDSKEKWVATPAEKFGGKTYQEALRALPDDEARMIFEMDNAAARTIRRMLKIDMRDERVHITRLDRLIVDVELEEYRRIFAFLGFSGDALEVCINIARRRSVFSDRIRPGGHVRHTQPAIWKQRFTPAIAAEFEKRFPGAAESLGYEPTFRRETA